MKHFFAALFATAFCLATTATAQDNPVVVELYTSQGCSSCYAADAIMHDLAPREDVIALALHVDYWDYIGWKDPFGNPAHAARQRAYAAAGQRRSIYTPEMVVAGVTDIVGAKPMELSRAIAEHARQPARVTLSVTRENNIISIQAPVMKDSGAVMSVHMLRYTPLHTTDVKRGENRGRTLENANVVEDWTVLGQWDGRAPLAMTAPVKGDKPVVVIVQQQNAGPILAAARLR